MLNIVDGGSLTDLAKKGNLSYVEELYNPGNFFDTVYNIVFKKEDMTVSLNNRTIKPILLKRIRRIPKIEFLLDLLCYLFQMIRIPRTYGIHIIRSRGPYLAGLLSVFAGKLNRLPVVVSLGGDNRLAQQLEGEYFLRSRLLSFKWEEFVLKHAGLVFCPNEFTRMYVKSLGVQDERIAVVPLLLPDRVFHQNGNELEVRRELQWLDQPIVLTVSRLTPYKQVDVLVEAIPMVLRRVPNAKFLFVGDGPSRKGLVDRCEELGIEPSVRFIGFQPTDRVVGYLSAAALVLVPMSGFGIYEAAAAGKPIVAFDVEWHREFIENDVSGLIVRNRDRNALAKAVIRLLQNPSKANELGKKARGKLLREYEPSRVIDQETGIYSHLIQTNRQ